MLAFLAERRELSILNMIVTIEYSCGCNDRIFDLRERADTTDAELPAVFCRTQLLLGTGESRFENVADRLPATTVELNQSQLLDRPKVPTSGVDFDSG